LVNKTKLNNNTREVIPININLLHKVIIFLEILKIIINKIFHKIIKIISILRVIKIRLKNNYSHQILHNMKMIMMKMRMRMKMIIILNKINCTTIKMMMMRIMMLILELI
jgi:hypothetical protein